MSSSTETGSTVKAPTGLDPALMAVIAKRFDAIVREMGSTLLRAGRSAVINVARDFSCSIVTADDELLAAAEGLPVHIFGSQLQTAEMRRRHPDLRPGDAFLDNDPYTGNSHHADHTILVPVFVGGKHMFTAVAKAHQADIGNSTPTTYAAAAKDIYEEGALSFPCVQIQRDGEDVLDIIEMCRRRIRVPQQWYGDYLATLGAARTGERRLIDLVEMYGAELIEEFVREWLDYSERRMEHAIGELRSGTFVRESQHDSIGTIPAIPLKASVTVDAEARCVQIDLRDNPDCVPAGLNLTRATASNMAIAGLFGNVDPDIPANSGSFRRVEVLLRENCVVGIPQHPVCASVATTNVASRLVGLVQAAIADGAEEGGAAEGGSGMGPGLGVIAGTDFRTGEPFVNQLIVNSCGGPGAAGADGWLNWIEPSAAGLLYRDSVEIDEQKYPILFDYLRVTEDSGGPGEFRGAPGIEVAYTTRGGPATVMWVLDCHERPAHGVRGGEAGDRAQALLQRAAAAEVEVLPGTGQVNLEPGDLIVNLGAGGGGLGNPRRRDPESVLWDHREGYVSRGAAEETYAVAFAGSLDDDSLRVDQEKTDSLRAAP
jgi:N-methylhydantoinase B